VAAPVVEPAAKADLIVLLPDEGGTVGRAIVSNSSGSVELSEARGATRVTMNEAPTPVQILGENETQDIFGAAVAALPQAPQHFVLLFKFGSEELTDESRKLVQDVMRTIAARPVPDVIVLGHTDTTGSAASNVQLGQQRANAIRVLLIEAGLDAASVQAISSGESELLVRTADEVYEPRNRRVEITVR
jgi:outer membrane protein OmpA-like peptidoglycan-associated protein